VGPQTKQWEGCVTQIGEKSIGGWVKKVPIRKGGTSPEETPPKQTEITMKTVRTTNEKEGSRLAKKNALVFDV